MSILRGILFLLLCFSCFTVSSSTYIIRDYFDGFRWHLGPFKFSINDQTITEIKGPLSQKAFNLLESKVKSNNSQIYFYPDLDLIPGLVDSHIHLSFEDESFDTNHDMANRQMFRDDQQSLALAHMRLDQGFNRGFLTLRDLGGNPDALRKTSQMIARAPDRYPTLYHLKDAFASVRGQCPKGVDCKDSFRKLPQTPSALKNYFKAPQKNLHHKVFLDNDPYPGVLKKNHIIALLKEAKKKRAPLALHTIKQKDFSWIVPFLYPQLSLEHLNSLVFASIEDQVQVVLASKARFVPSLYSKTYMQLLEQKNKLPNHWQWERDRQLKVINSLAKLSPLLCFGSDFYFPSFSPLRDWAFYAIEILRDFEKETFLKTDQVLSMATGACNELFPGSSAGLIKEGASASFNLVGGNLKSDIRYLHNIQGVVQRGRPHRLPSAQPNFHTPL